MAKTLAFLTLLCLALHGTQVGAVECNSTVGQDDGGTCTGEYCFNMEDKIRGCVSFYRMIRDDNIACGHMHLMGSMRKVCICTQPYCGKYEVANMPVQTLANVTCTDDTMPSGSCTPGPCYVGNDLARYGTVRPTDQPDFQRTCMQDWFAVTDFKELIMYEVPPLAGHAACFFDSDGMYNCMCKDPGCNAQMGPTMQAETDDQHYTCYKAECRMGTDPQCTDTYLGNETCVGQMCYYLKAQYDFQLDGKTYKESKIVRDCLNYSHANPIGDLTFVTGFEFGKSTSVFYPCQGEKCNDKT